jgi:DNA polymerase sigma
MKIFSQSNKSRKNYNKSKRDKMRHKNSSEESSEKRWERKSKSHEFKRRCEKLNIDRPKYKKVYYAPWLSDETKQAPGSERLHHEILDFYKFISPKEEENSTRKQTLKELKNMITKKWPMWKVKVFGSFPNGLHLTDSDIDLVIFKNTNFNFSTDSFSHYDALMSDNEMLIDLYQFISTSGFSKEMRYVDAKVPIIKVKARNGINFDIS